MNLLKLKFSNLVVIVALISCAAHCTPCIDHISVSPDELTFEANETDAKQVIISTNADTWVSSVTSGSDWLHASNPVEGGTFLSVTVEPHSNTEYSREGQITVTTDRSTKPATIRVIQRARHSLQISPTSLTFDWNAQDEQKVCITTNSNVGWDHTTAPSWLTLTKSGSELIVKPRSDNTGSLVRKAEISIAAGSSEIEKLTVTQNARPLLTISPTSISFANNTQSRFITVTSNVSWTVSSNTSWLTVSPSSGSNNGSIVVSFNTSTSSRAGTITVSGSGITRTITVSQPAG